MKYRVEMIQEDVIAVEVEANSEEEAMLAAGRGEYDNWEVLYARSREPMDVEPIKE